MAEIIKIQIMTLVSEWHWSN